MPQSEIEKIAEMSKIIVAGYSFTPDENGLIRILNLENPEKAAVLDKTGEILETTMDDNELALVQAYYFQNKEFLEEQDT